MKPHRLRIEAFGPYAEPVEIGFDALGREGLFLIHGPTGAGKTFLLDALCFALYGEVSGDRSVKALRSDHAPPGAVPRVSLEFSAAGARYLVERSPAHTAPRTRGEGTTEKTAQAVLFRLVAAGREPVVSRATEVTREVEGLVGLNARQFRQVILLPQGRFAEVLRAGAEEREALLKTLFDTVAFEQAGIWLEERARAARIEVAEQNRAQEVLRRQAAHEWGPFAPPPAEVEPIADQEGLDRLQQRIAAVVAAAAHGLQQAGASLETAQRGRAEIERLADRWDRRAAAAARLAELEGKQALVEDYRLRLQRAERAETLRASVEAAAAAQAELTGLRQRIDALLQAAIRARDVARALPEAVRGLDLITLPGLEALGGARSALAARRVEVMALAGKAREAAQAGAAAAEASRLAAAAQATLASGATALAERQRQRQVAAEALQKACSARDRLEGLERAAQEARQRARAVEAIAVARRLEGEAVAAQGRAEARLERAVAGLQDLRRRQIAGMAARLAGGLAREEPCPVCGSTHHPAPARPSEDAATDEAIGAAEREVSAATTAAREAAAALATARADLKGLLEQAGDAADDPAAAGAAAGRAETALRDAGTWAGQVDPLQRAIGDLDQELETLQGVLQAATTEQALQNRAAAESTRLAEALGAEIGAELGEGVDPQAVLASFAAMEAALKELAAGAEAGGRAEARHRQAAARLADELAGSEFADAAAVRAALEEASWRRRLAGRIEAYETERIEVRALLGAPDLADLPEQRPDTAAAEAAVQQADAVRTAALERHSQARRAHTEIARLAGEHRSGAADLARRVERAQLLGAVADRCQGKAAPFISLQRWVLSAYLADICGYANQRLQLMTSGRYQLRLSDGGGRGGRQAGLGLRVLDAYTGEEREVSSLSGGETFQASLALALGVADTVQAHAGGVALEALFIDEGFGTLDPDNLQLAMDELDRLREGGRMIGIISHVGALRERIRCGIEVVAGDRGSRVEVGALEMV